MAPPPRGAAPRVGWGCRATRGADRAAAHAETQVPSSSCASVPRGRHPTHALGRLGSRGWGSVPLRAGQGSGPPCAAWGRRGAWPGGGTEAALQGGVPPEHCGRAWRGGGGSGCRSRSVLSRCPAGWGGSRGRLQGAGRAWCLRACRQGGPRAATAPFPRPLAAHSRTAREGGGGARSLGAGRGLARGAHKEQVTPQAWAQGAHGQQPPPGPTPGGKGPYRPPTPCPQFPGGPTGHVDSHSWPPTALPVVEGRVGAPRDVLPEWGPSGGCRTEARRRAGHTGAAPHALARGGGPVSLGELAAQRPPPSSTGAGPCSPGAGPRGGQSTDSSADAPETRNFIAENSLLQKRRRTAIN